MRGCAVIVGMWTYSSVTEKNQKHKILEIGNIRTLPDDIKPYSTHSPKVLCLL